MDQVVKGPNFLGDRAKHLSGKLTAATKRTFIMLEVFITVCLLYCKKGGFKYNSIHRRLMVSTLIYKSVSLSGKHFIHPQPARSPQSFWWTSFEFLSRCHLSTYPEQTAHPQPFEPALTERTRLNGTWRTWSMVPFLGTAYSSSDANFLIGVVLVYWPRTGNFLLHICRSHKRISISCSN